MRQIAILCLLSLAALAMPAHAEDGGCEINVYSSCGAGGDCRFNVGDSHCYGNCTLNVNGYCDTEGECEVNLADHCNEYRPLLKDCTEIFDPENFTCLLY